MEVKEEVENEEEEELEEAEEVVEVEEERVKGEVKEQEEGGEEEERAEEAAGEGEGDLQGEEEAGAEGGEEEVGEVAEDLSLRGARQRYVFCGPSENLHFGQNCFAPEILLDSLQIHSGPKEEAKLFEKQISSGINFSK